MSNSRKRSKRSRAYDGSGDVKEKPDIHWQSSAARAIMLADLECQHLPLYDFHLDARGAWDVYQHLEEFKNVPFTQFARQLQAHRNQVLQRKTVIEGEEQAMRQFRAMNPRKQNDCRGNPVIDMMPVKDLLREDVKMDRHIGLTPSEFRMLRPEYRALDCGLFKQRLYQEIGRKKHLFTLNEKSLKEREETQKRHAEVASRLARKAGEGGSFAHV